MIINTSRGFISLSIILAIVICVAVLGGGAYAYTQNKQKNQVERTNPFPTQLGTYAISTEVRKPENGSKCEVIGDHPDTASAGLKGEVCYSIQTAEYRESGSNRGIFITAQKFTKGRDLFEQYFSASTKAVEVNGKKIRRLESHELLWWTANSSSFDLIFTQEFSVNSDGSYKYGTATGANPVTTYLLDQYSPGQ